MRKALKSAWKAATDDQTGQAQQFPYQQHNSYVSPPSYYVAPQSPVPQTGQPVSPQPSSYQRGLPPPPQQWQPPPPPPPPPPRSTAYAQSPSPFTNAAASNSVLPPLPSRSPMPNHSQATMPASQQAQSLQTISPPPQYALTPSPASPPTQLPYLMQVQPSTPHHVVQPQHSPAPGSSPRTNMAPRPVPGAAEPPSIRKVLCLDGGGVRGLSEIFILKAIMRRVSDERGFPDWETIEPWQEFDMICGTSTGGLLAIMLGRLRMTLDECEEAYENISKEIFTPVRSSANVVGRSKDFLTASGKFSATPLENTVKRLLRERGIPEDELLWDRASDTQSPFVFVCATSSFGGPTCLRSYRNREAEDRLLQECRVWQAARATSAASTFFPPVDIGRRTFVDGAEAGDNNPIEVAEREAREMFKGQECMFISIGTGKGTPKDITGNLDHLIKALLSILTESEKRNTRFHNQHQQWVIDDRLFRFNVTTGLGEVGLDEYKDIRLIDEYTSLYFEEAGVLQNLARCAKALKAGGQRLHILAGDDLALHLEKLQVSTVIACRCVHCRTGIPYNTDLFFCMECESDICPACRGAHKVEHSQWMVRVDVVMWQRKMKSYPDMQTCRQCLESRRARLFCKSCDWVMCSACWAQESWRNTQWLEHRKSHPEHRMLTQIDAPWSYLNPLAHTVCRCEDSTQPYPANHCGRCFAVVTLNQQLHWCRNCRLEYSSAQLLCQQCWSSEPAEHREQHHFQKIHYTMVQSDNDDYNKQNAAAYRCLDCTQVLAMGALEHHPHENLTIACGPHMAEMHRQWVVRNCPSRTRLNDGRQQPDVPVSGLECTFCEFPLGWGELSGMCLWSGCCKIFCNRCLESNRHGHRHVPMQRVRYQQNTASSFQLNSPIYCDACMKQSYRGMFTGIECAECRNKHFCLDCILKVTKGHLKLEGDGVHGCPAMTWTFTRY